MSTTKKFVPNPGTLPELHPSLKDRLYIDTLSQFERYENYFIPSHRKPGEYLYYHYVLPKFNAQTNEQTQEESINETSNEASTNETTNENPVSTSNNDNEKIEEINKIVEQPKSSCKCGKKIKVYKDLNEYPHIDKLKGILLFVHGYADHSMRLLPWFGLDKLVGEYNLALCGIDHEGHGLSFGTRGYVKSIPQIASDIIALIKERFPKDFGKQLPIYLLGHSMGGLISLELLRMEAKLFKIAVLSSPLLVPASDSSPPKLVQSIAVSFSKYEFLGKIALVEGNKGKIYTDSSLEQVFMDDPLTYSGKMRLGTGSSFLQSLTTFTDENLKQISSQLPCLVHFGDKDKSCDVSGAHRLGENGFQKRIFENMAHELFKEPCKEEMLNDLHEFIKSHLD